VELKLAGEMGPGEGGGDYGAAEWSWSLLIRNDRDGEDKKQFRGCFMSQRMFRWYSLDSVLVNFLKKLINFIEIISISMTKNVYFIKIYFMINLMVLIWYYKS